MSSYFGTKLSIIGLKKTILSPNASKTFMHHRENFLSYQFTTWQQLPCVFTICQYLSRVFTIWQYLPTQGIQDQRPASLRDKHLLLTQAMINMITLWLEATHEKSTLQRSESSLSFVPTLYAFKIPLSVSKASTSSVSMTAVKNLQRLEVVFNGCHWVTLILIGCRSIVRKSKFILRHLCWIVGAAIAQWNCLILSYFISQVRIPGKQCMLCHNLIDSYYLFVIDL